MRQAIGAYRTVTSTAEFREIERLRSRARNNEASALGNAQRKKAVEIAKNFLQMDLTVEQIVKGTGLSKDEVEALHGTDK